MNLIDGLVRSQAAQMARYEEKVVRTLLGNWVSELEPSIVRQDRGLGVEIVGLTALGHDKVVVWRE